MRTLTGRLILSHILPLLIVIPAAGLVLDYVLETRFLRANLASELTTEAALIAALALDHPAIWEDPAAAQAFVNRAALPATAQAMLLDTDGVLLASTEAADMEQVGRPLPDTLPLEKLLNGETARQTNRAPDNAVDIFMPVQDADGRTVGIVRLTQPLTNVYDQFLALRYLITAVLVAALLVGAAITWFLGNSLGRSLSQATEAARKLAQRQRLEPLPEEGPEEIKQLLRSVNTLAAQLEALEQNRRQLLANLVHELSNPLSALRSATNALLGGAGEDEALRRDLLIGMQGEEEKLNRLLADLSGLHDQISGSLALEIRPLPLPPFLTRVTQVWREAALYKGLNWQVDVPDTLPPARADEDRLAQIVGNLLSNAIKYTPSGGAVAVSAGRQGAEVWIRVADTGTGIPPEDLPHIFTPFYRGSANSRFADGMGLGLSIARDLVIAQEGRLTVASQPGAGSQFTVWLPAARQKTLRLL